MPSGQMVVGERSATSLVDVGVDVGGGDGGGAEEVEVVLSRLDQLG